MKLISQMLGVNSTYELEDKSIPEKPKVQKSTPIRTRIDRSELEEAYYKSPLVFNSINKIVQTILSGNPELVCKNKKILDYYNNFLDNIGFIGGEAHWDEVLEQIFRYQCIYGEAYVEIIYNVKGDKIVDLALIDPKKIDYAKDKSGNIALDSYGRPLGYVQTLPYEQMQQNQKGEINIDVPPSVKLEANQIFIPPDNIAHFKLYTVGEGFYGIGLVESAYQDIKTQLNLEQDYGEKAHSTLFPTRVATVGDLNHEPSPQKVQSILQNLRKAVYSTEIAIPYHVKLDMLQPKNPATLRDFLEYFGDDVISGMGIPKPYATGRGGDLTRAALDKMNQLFELSLRDIIARTTKTIERQIFRKIAFLENFSEYPKFQWGPIGVEEASAKANRLIEYVKVGIISPDDPQLLEMIKKMEEFPATY
jgi:ribonucleotide reductase beta subunit family protein with ferritin-like domain